MALIKFSILSFYCSIFPQKNFRIVSIGVAIFVAMWAISAILVSIFQCVPIAFGWDPTIENGHCINYGALVLATGICNVITDFFIFAMPVPNVLRLQLSSQKKRQVLGTFFMGGSACIVSIVRLAFTLQVATTSDLTWDAMPGALASTAELMVGIIAASLSVYGPLIRRLYGKSPTPTVTSRIDTFALQHTSHSIRIGRQDAATSRSAPDITVTKHFTLSSGTDRDDGWVEVGDDDNNCLYNTGEQKRNKKSGSSTFD